MKRKDFASNNNLITATAAIPVRIKVRTSQATFAERNSDPALISLFSSVELSGDIFVPPLEWN